MNPQMLAMLMQRLQGGGMGAPGGGAMGGAGVGGPQGPLAGPLPMLSPVGGGVPNASMGPPQAAPGAMSNPASVGPMSSPTDAPLDPQRMGDMWNPPFSGQEMTGPGGGGQDQQRAADQQSLPRFPRTPLGALLIPNAIGGGNA